MFKKVFGLSAGALALMPVLAFGQAAGNGLLSGETEEIDSLFTAASTIMGYVVAIVIALAVIYFLIGLLSYIKQSGDEAKQKEARGMMLWGIIIIFVMVSVWGLVNVLQSVLGVGSDIDAQVPNIPSLEL